MKPILLVEGETIIRESLKVWLKDRGYKVETAKNGEEALKNVNKKDYGMAILELQLPDKDGIEVLKTAREKRPKMKGIIMTAYPSVQTAVEALKEGAVDYMIKPLVLNELENLLKEHLGTTQVMSGPVADIRRHIARTQTDRPLAHQRADSFWKDKTPCWEMCQCPDEIRKECPAARHQSIPCWEIEGTFCKLDDYKATGRDTRICEICPVFKTWGKDRPIKIGLFGSGINTVINQTRR